jgi:hypothetical protein
MRTRVLTLAALLLAAPIATSAQSRYEADFPVVRERVARGEMRQAGYTLMLASAHLREEVGRCRDGAVGERLLAAESRLDGLVATLRTGQAAPLASLDASFAAADRVLAEHHVVLAAWETANLRTSSVADVAHDLDRAVLHFGRGVRWQGRPLDAGEQRAMEDAKRLASQLDGARTLPGETGAVIAALNRVIVPPQAVATQRAPH